MKIKRFFKQALATAGAITIAATNLPVMAAPRTLNSYGIITSTDDSGATVTIDADDIRANYAAIYQIRQQLAGLAGKVLNWSDDMSTYVITTYKTDENGDIIYDENGDPIIESEEAIGALGTADPTMVVENRTFSSLYAKTIYTGVNTTKSPGVEQNGTLVDILNNGFTANQVNGQSYYATSDTTGTDTSTRDKNKAVTNTTGGTRTDKLDVTTREYTDPSTIKDTATASVPTTGADTETVLTAGQYTSAADDQYLLDVTNRLLTLGINESVTLPAGYYSDNITINNGVVNQTNTGKITISDTVDTADTAVDNKTASAGNKKITVANGTYDINKFDTTTSLALGAEGKVTLPAGYYAKDILVQNTSKDILSGNYAAYTEGSYNATTGTNGNNASHPDISALGTSPYILGINESVTLPAGYYSKQVTVNNGVVNQSNNGTISVSAMIGSKDTLSTNQTNTAGNLYKTTAAKDDYQISVFNNSSNPINLGAGASTTFPAGYYSTPITVVNTVKDILGDTTVKNITNASYTAAKTDTGTNSSRNNLTTTNTSIVLGYNEQTTLPAGFYSKPITISNGVRDRLGQKDTATKVSPSPSSNTGLADSSLALSTNTTTYNLNINQGITLPAGFYSKAITINNGIVNRNNSIKSALLATTFPAGYYSGKDINVPNIATYKTVNGSDNNGINSNASISTSTANSYNLGINDALVFPAGYYNQSITVNNSIINKGSKDITITNASETITLPAGYYSKITAHTSIDASSFPNASLTYYLKHQHVDANGEVHDSEYIAETPGGCYTEYYTWTTHEKTFKCKDCVKCDYEGIDNLCDDYDERDVPHEGYKCNCGKTAGASEGTASSAALIQPYQAIYKVEIQYNE